MNRASKAPSGAAELVTEGIGTTAFGKYQLFASLGRGGMADVFLSVARGQMGFNKLAVVKRLRPALAEEAAFRNMFLDEARLAARLSHPNIVHTYEVGEHKGVYFIAMEYLEGQSLNKVLKEAYRRKARLEPMMVVRVIADALAGLGHAHDLRDYDGRPLSVIHRDVSPHNIFVTYDGHTKLVDFGIAKAALSSSAETEVGVLKGKVAYMSPEQAMGQRIDARSDLFAMGIVLWELVTQQRLMTGENAANTLHKLMNEPIPRLVHVLPNVDPELDMIVSRALEKDPNRRWQSAAEMRASLEAWLAMQPPPAMRQEDVGKVLVSLFAPVREEVQRQIQRHMAALDNATTTQELQALTAESLQRMEQSSAAMTGQLLRLGTAGAGSGSGVVANYGGLGSTPSVFPSLPTLPPAAPYATGHHPVPAPAPTNNILLIVITVGCFLLAALLIVVLLGKKPPAPEFAQPQPPVITTAVTPARTAEPTGEPTASVTAAVPTVSAKHHPTTAPVVTRVLTVPTKPATPAAPAEDPGFVTVSAYPWAKVSEGGKVLCPVTPCNKVTLPVGTHALVFENGTDPTQKQSVTVQIKSGETATKNVGFK